MSNVHEANNYIRDTSIVRRPPYLDVPYTYLANIDSLI